MFIDNSAKTNWNVLGVVTLLAVLVAGGAFVVLMQKEALPQSDNVARPSIVVKDETVEGESSVKLSPDKQVIQDANGVQILYIDMVKRSLEDDKLAEKYFSKGSMESLLFSNVILSPNESKVAFSVVPSDGSYTQLSFIFDIQTKEMILLDRYVSEPYDSIPGGHTSPTFWSPDSRFILIQHSLEVGDAVAEEVIDVLERKVLSSIYNNFSLKEIVGWSSNSSIDYIEQGRENYIDITWRFNIHSGVSTKILETPYPLPKPTIFRAAAEEPDGGKVRLDIRVDTGLRELVRLYWALDKDGPWSEHKYYNYGPQIMFTPPDVDGEKVFYRVTTFATDERGEGPSSQTIEVPTKCCWIQYFDN